MCDEFPALTPTAALEELATTPAGWLWEVIEARHYAKTKALVDAADTPEQRAALPRGELVELVTLITFDEVQREIDAREGDR